MQVAAKLAHRGSQYFGGSGGGDSSNNGKEAGKEETAVFAADTGTPQLEDAAEASK